MAPFSPPALSVPHRGYHGGGTVGYGGVWGDRRFFEGWYHRLTLPDGGGSFAWMAAIQNPYPGEPHGGGAVQVLLPGDTCFFRSFPDLAAFRADRRSLAASHGRASPWGREFYEFSAVGHRGHLRDLAGETSLRWDLAIDPVDGWGPRDRPQRATGGWLSYLPLADPGWQGLMARGWASGQIEWGDRRYAFARAPVYAEKNWGRQFPRRWFWAQCNAFPGFPELSVTAGGGDRALLPDWLGGEAAGEFPDRWRQGWGAARAAAKPWVRLPRWEPGGVYEALAGLWVHWRGRFYDFAPWTASVRWRVSPWGRWELHGDRPPDRPGAPPHRIALEGTAPPPGTRIRGPTADGFVPVSRHTLAGHLRLRLWQGDRLLLDATSPAAGLETGGEPWVGVWAGPDEDPRDAPPE